MEINGEENLNLIITSYLKILERELQHFKKEKLKSSTKDKTINSFHLQQYLIEHHKKFPKHLGTVIWDKHKFSSQFLSDLSKYDYNIVIHIILNLLFGNFENIRDPLVHKEPLSGFFSIIIKSSTKLFFAIYFKAISDNSTYVEETIEFLGICQPSLIESRTKSFIFKKFENTKKKSKYPLIEYDLNGFLKNKYFLFQRKKKIGNNTIYYPHHDFPATNQQELHRVIIGGIEERVFNEQDVFIHRNLTEETLNQSSKMEYNDLIINLIKNNKWGIVFSKQEFALIKAQLPVMLSGKPGTGKTTVILIKLLAEFVDLQLKRSLIAEQKINWDLIQMFSKEEQFRNVFTSLSNKLCETTNDDFIDLLEKMKLDVSYSRPTNKIRTFKDKFDYPLFVNFRKLLFLIDSSLTHQFFRRLNFSQLNLELDEQELFFINKATYPVGNMNCSIEEKDFDSYTIFLRNTGGGYGEYTEVNEDNFNTFFNSLVQRSYSSVQFQVLNNATKVENKQLSWTKALEERVLYQLYDMKKRKVKINSAEIYSQIYSVIKGSLTSSNSFSNCISREEYLNRGKKGMFLQEEYLNMIYDICILYEHYKRQNMQFDIQDLTNYLIKQVKIELFSKNITLIDYLYIDEIQDLTINQIYLLILVAKRTKLYAGDTGQTISEINRFKFKDLKNLFFHFQKIVPNFPEVKDAILNFNFRLNINILKFSSFISELTQQFFPYSVDKLKEDISLKLTSFKPMLLNDLSKIEEIIIVNQNIESVNKNLTLSRYSAWLFRSEETEKQIRNKYTERGVCQIDTYQIHECKGMEFELVIVYNFFTESKYIKLWDKVLNQITLEKKSSDLEELKEKLQKENFTMIRKNIIQTCPEILGYKNFEDSTKQEQYIKNLFESSSFQNTYEEDKKKIISLIINEKKNYVYPKKKEDFTFDIHKYFEFCTELKKFYVLISRPKTFLLFYEDKNNKNVTPETQCIINGIYFYFIKYGLVIEYNENIVPTIIDYFNKITFYLINEEELREIAWKEFNKKNYKRASFFFLKTKLRKEGLLSLSFDLYEKLRMISDETTNGKKDRENIAQNIIQYLNEIGEYGDINDKIGIKGYCFEIIGEYSNAIKEYEKRKMYDRCGNIAYKKLENIDFAMYYYKLHGNIEMTLFLLNKKKAYKKIFEYLSLIIDQLDLFDYNKMVKQYINIYWQNIIPEIKYINLKFDVNPNRTQKQSNLLIETFDIFHLKLKRFFNEQTKSSIQLESYLNFFIDINELDDYFNSETSKKQIISFFHKYHSNIVKLKRKKPHSYNSDETKEINFYDNVDTTIKLILKYLSELEASELLNNFIDTYLLGNNDSIIQTIIEQTPYLMCHKKSSFKIESYASYLFSSEQSFQIFRENSKQVNKIINEIIFNTEKDDLFLQNVILKLKTIHHFFLDIFDEKDLYKINNCIGSILSLPHIIEFKIENIGQHYIQHLSSILYNISSYIRIHLCNLLIEPSLYCHQFENIFLFFINL